MKKLLILPFALFLMGQSVFASQSPSDSVDQLSNCHLWELDFNINDATSKDDLLKIIGMLQGLKIVGSHWYAQDPKAFFYSIEFDGSKAADQFFHSPQGLAQRQNLAQAFSSINGVQVTCSQLGDPVTNPRGSIGN